MTAEREADDSRHQAISRLIVFIIGEIAGLVAALETAREEGSAEYDQETHTEEEMQTIIQEHPGEVQVRSEWHKPTEFEAGNSEFYIILYPKKPVVRILGELDHLHQVTRARLQYQDSGSLGWWEILDIDEEQQKAILEYCHQFNFAG